MNTKTPPPAWKRRGRHHAQIHLPPLSGEEALLLCNLMDRAIEALWRTHGHAMAEVLSNLYPLASVPDEHPPLPTITPPSPEPNLDDIF